MTGSAFRKRIFEVVETSRKGDRLSLAYDIFMILVIAFSILPLCYRRFSETFRHLEETCTLIFCIDYLLRLLTADFKIKKGKRSFLLYPFTPFAIIDLLSLIPTFIHIAVNYLTAFHLFDLLRILRVLRAFKVFRYSRQFKRVLSVIHSQRKPLLSVLVMAIGYIFLSGLIMFNAEPENFSTLFDALYWATTALTTVGYGDIYPVSVAGRIVSMVTSVMGIAVVALPAGIITGGYMEEIHKEEMRKEDSHKEQHKT